MTQHITAGPARRVHITDLARAAGRKLSDRIHCSADDRARARGWQITHTPGRFGLGGRAYRDPRFADRQITAARTAGVS